MIGAYKLTEEQVREIKRLFLTTDLTDEEISQMFNVSRQHINHIRNERRWGRETYNMVQDPEVYSTITSNIVGVSYISSITEIQTRVGKAYVVLHYTDNELWFEPSTIYMERPDFEKLKEKHFNYIKRFI